MSISCYPLHRVRTKTGMRENNKAGAHAPKPTCLELEHWTRLDRRYPNHRYQIHIDTSRGPSSLDACDSMVASRQRSSCTGMRARAGIPPRIAPPSQRASAAVVQTFALRIACRRLPPPAAAAASNHSTLQPQGACALEPACKQKPRRVSR